MSQKKTVSANFSYSLFLSTHDDLAVPTLDWLSMVQFRVIQFGVVWFREFKMTLHIKAQI